MQGASRAALDEAWGEVERELSSSGKSSHAEATRVADELFGTLAVLDAQVGLRRALSDPAVEADRKTALVDAVFGSQISPVALGIVVNLVKSRWSRARDLPDAIETLAVLAAMIGGDHAGKSDDVEDELFRFGRIIEARPALREALSSAALPEANKLSLVDALLKGRATATTLRLANQIATHPRGRSPEDALADYGRVAARRGERSVARVTTAFALSAVEVRRLQAALVGLYGHDVHLQIEIDESIIGGVIVQVGDEVLDGSIAGRLADARRRIE
jgi:F-type H+-transporting ATPase subunit delta